MLHGEDLYDCASMREVLARATSKESQNFLDSYIGQDCLHSCATSRACCSTLLSIAQKVAAGATVTINAAVGASGSRRVRLMTMGRRGAVRPRGASCDVTSECCDAECRNGYCGGFQCKSPQEPCSAAYQCCSKRCFDERAPCRTVRSSTRTASSTRIVVHPLTAPSTPKWVDGACALVVETCAAEGEACGLSATNPSAAGCCPWRGRVRPLIGPGSWGLLYERWLRGAASSAPGDPTVVAASVDWSSRSPFARISRAGPRLGLCGQLSVLLGAV